jgi:hypothetical protein
MMPETSSALIDREQQRKKIRELFAQMAEVPFAAMEFYGVGGLGKSRVLEIAKQESREQGFPLTIVDLLLSDCSNSLYPRYDLLLRISDQIDLFSDFNRGRLLISTFVRDRKLEKGAAANNGEDDILLEYHACLANALGDQPLILVLDSVEHCKKEIFDWLGRQLLAPLVLDRKLSSLVVFLAGRGPRVRESRWPPILKNATQSFRLDPFDFESTVEHIRALPLKGEYRKAAKDIYALSNGHPYGTEEIASWLNSLGVNVESVGEKKKELADRMKEEVIRSYILSDAGDWVLPLLEIASHFRWFTTSDLHSMLEVYRPELGKNQPIQWTTARLVDLQRRPLHLIYLEKDSYVIEPTLRKLLHIAYIFLHPEEAREIHLDISKRLEGQLHSDAALVTEILYHQAQARIIVEEFPRVELGWFKCLLEEHFDPHSSDTLEELGLLKNKLERDDELADLLSEDVLVNLVDKIDEYLTSTTPFQLSHLSIEFTMPSEYRVSWFLADQTMLPTERVHSPLRFDLDEWRDRTQEVGKTAYSAFLPSRAQQFIREKREWAIQLTTNRVDIPWELLHDDEGILCLSRPVGRRPENLKEPKQLPPREEGSLRALVVGNPTDDLPGAEAEAKAVAEMLLGCDGEVDLLITSEEATAKEFVIKIRNQNYDLIHYAGHGYFERKMPGLSGLFFNDGPVYAEEIERVLGSRAFVFLSACDLGRSETTASEAGRFGEFVEGVATSVMLGGAIGCLGPIWEIGDEVAKDFALAFYRHLLSGHPLGEAVRRARIEARENRSSDFWKSWVLYGDPLRKLPNYTSRKNHRNDV